MFVCLFVFVYLKKQRRLQGGERLKETGRKEAKETTWGRGRAAGTNKGNSQNNRNKKYFFFLFLEFFRVEKKLTKHMDKHNDKTRAQKENKRKKKEKKVKRKNRNR